MNKKALQMRFKHSLYKSNQLRQDKRKDTIHLTCNHGGMWFRNSPFKAKTLPRGSYEMNSLRWKL